MNKRGGSKKRGMKTRSIVSLNNSLVTSLNIIDSFTTGLSALMRQKVAESGMIANREPGAIDWEIIPNASIHDDTMDVDPHSDEWVDILEEDMGSEGKAAGRLQTVISYAFPPSPLSCICDGVVFQGYWWQHKKFLPKLFTTRASPCCGECVDRCFATTCWPVSHMEAHLCPLPSRD